MTRVQIIRRTGQSCLVEWTDTREGAGALRRVVVPFSSVVDNEVDPEELDRGVPYGINWEGILDLRVTPGTVAQELRKRGIWTAQDLRAHLPQAVAAVETAVGVDVLSLMRAAERVETNDSGG